MGKLVNLEFRKNKKFISRSLLIYLILLILAVFIEFRMGFKSVFSMGIFVNGIFAAGIFLFAFLLTFYILFTNYKDYYKDSAILTFTLPAKSGSYVKSKVISSLVFYLINLVFLLMIFKIMGFVISRELLYYFFLGLLWVLIINSIVILTMQYGRFRQTSRPVIRGLIIFVIIFALGFLICKYFSLVLVNHKLQMASPMDYAFIFPFAIGKYGLYINFTPTIYYFLANIILAILASRNLNQNLDLS